MISWQLFRKCVQNGGYFPYTPNPIIKLVILFFKFIASFACLFLPFVPFVHVVKKI